MRVAYTFFIVVLLCLLLYSCSKEDSRFISAGQDIELRDDGHRAEYFDAIGLQLNLSGPTGGIYDPTPPNGIWNYVHYRVTYDDTGLPPIYDTIPNSYSSAGARIQNGKVWSVRSNGKLIRHDADQYYYLYNDSIEIKYLDAAAPVGTNWAMITDYMPSNSIYVGEGFIIEEVNLSLSVQGVSYTNVIKIKTGQFLASSSTPPSIPPIYCPTYKYYAPMVGLILEENNCAPTHLSSQLTLFLQ